MRGGGCPSMVHGRYEEWIYSDEGFDGQKSMYTARTEKLNELGAPLLHRRKQFEERPRAIEEFNRARVAQLDKINNQDEKCVVVVVIRRHHHHPSFSEYSIVVVAPPAFVVPFTHCSCASLLDINRFTRS